MKTILILHILALLFCHAKAESFSDDTSYKAWLKKQIALGYSSYVSRDISHSAASEIEHTGKCAKMLDDYIIKNRARLTETPPGTPLTMGLGMYILNLGDVSDTDQTVSMTVIILIKWSDYRLSSDYVDYGSLDCTNTLYALPNIQSIWYAPFTIENSATDKLLNYEAWEKFPVFLTGTGVVDWRISLRLTVNCDMDFTLYPLDWQNCYVLIRFPYLLYQVIVLPNEANTALYEWEQEADNPMWSISGQMVSLTHPTAGLKVAFRLDRKSTYFNWIILAPTVLISIGTILPFILPPDSEDKMSTMLTLLLSYFFLMLTLTATTPQTSDTMPIMLQFFNVILAIGMLGALACAVISRLNDKKPSAVKQLLYRYMFCPPISIKALNNACLVLYVLALAAAYAFLFISIYDGRRQRMARDAETYNYTDLTVFTMG